MTTTKPTPRRLLKLVERAQILRQATLDLDDMHGATDREAVAATAAAQRLVDALIAWNDALRPTSGQGGAS